MGLFFSVIIPVYNDPKGISVTLESLIIQDYPQEGFEIIVVDNGSTDNTLDVVKGFSQSYPNSIRYVIEDKIQSSYAARNKGIKESKGPVLIFIDADMSVDKNWLSMVHDSIERTKADYFTCMIEIYCPEGSLFSLYNKMAGFPIEEYVTKRHFAPTCCLVVRKSVFDELGLFDPNLISSGDYEFGNRVYSSGRRLFYNPDIIVRHPARSSFSQFVKKSLRIGRGFYQLSLRYPELYEKIYKKSLSQKPGDSWSLFTFKRQSREWKDMYPYKKVLIYLIDALNKLIKPIGFLYEKYRG